MPRNASKKSSKQPVESKEADRAGRFRRMRESLAAEGWTPEQQTPEAFAAHMAALPAESLRLPPSDFQPVRPVAVAVNTANPSDWIREFNPADFREAEERFKDWRKRPLIARAEHFIRLNPGCKAMSIATAISKRGNEKYTRTVLRKLIAEGRIVRPKGTQLYYPAKMYPVNGAQKVR